MRNSVQAARDSCLQRLGSTGARVPEGQPALTACTFRIATDCSGADAPIWACRQTQLKHVHVFSSDIWHKARSFLKCNTPPCEVMYDDMCARGCCGVPQHDVYVCGFPCQPFSTLRSKSRFFQEAKAKPFWAALKTIRASRPPMVLMENVAGIMRVQDTLKRALRTVQGYHFYLIPWDPRQLGEPVRRQRVFILGVRNSSVWFKTDSCALAMIHAVLNSVRKPVQCSGLDRLLPRLHPLRQQWADKCKRSGRHARPPNLHGSTLPPTKWIAVHRHLRQALRTRAACPPRPRVAWQGSAGASPSAISLGNARKHDLWRLLCETHGSSLFAADVSQQAGRSAVSVSGVLPTITPHSDIIVAPLGGPILPEESLLAHAFPVHRMRWPNECSARDIATLGGNTMHVQCVGSLILLGLCLLDLNHAFRSGVPDPSALGSTTVTLVKSSHPVTHGGTLPMKRNRKGEPQGTHKGKLGIRPKRASNEPPRTIRPTLQTLFA